MEVEFYETSSGSRPAAEFILEQSNKMKAKIATAIEYLEEMGTELRKPYSENLGEGILQLRVQTEGNKARLLYFFVVGNKAILTNGFIKKTNKTPTKELETAKRYRQDYLQRQGK